MSVERAADVPEWVTANSYGTPYLPDGPGLEQRQAEQQRAAAAISREAEEARDMLRRFAERMAIGDDRAASASLSLLVANLMRRLEATETRLAELEHRDG
jgi:phosphoserine phosphatase